MPEDEGIDTCGVWMVRCTLQKGGTNLGPLSVHSRPVEIVFLLSDSQPSVTVSML